MQFHTAYDFTIDMDDFTNSWSIYTIIPVNISAEGAFLIVKDCII